MATIADADPKAHNHPLDYPTIQNAIAASVDQQLHQANTQQCVEFPLHIELKEWRITSDIIGKFTLGCYIYRRIHQTDCFLRFVEAYIRAAWGVYHWPI